MARGLYYFQFFISSLLIIMWLKKYFIFGCLIFFLLNCVIQLGLHIFSLSKLWNLIDNFHSTDCWYAPLVRTEWRHGKDVYCSIGNKFSRCTYMSPKYIHNIEFGCCFALSDLFFLSDLYWHESSQIIKIMANVSNPSAWFTFCKNA